MEIKAILLGSGLGGVYSTIPLIQNSMVWSTRWSGTALENKLLRFHTPGGTELRY